MQVAKEPLKPLGRVVLDTAIGSTVAAKAPLIHRAVDALLNGGCITAAQRLLAEICLYEALTNAIIHGNREDPAKQVRLRVFAARNCWGAIIEDEGDGFNPLAVPDPRQEENVLRERGRGIALLNLYMDELTFNAKGNGVMLVKRRQEGSGRRK